MKIEFLEKITYIFRERAMLPFELRSMVKTFPAGPPFVCLWDMNVGLHRVVGNINAENFPLSSS